jgi:hypothetical protein
VLISTESGIKESKEGLRLTKRRKKRAALVVEANQSVMETAMKGAGIRPETVCDYIRWAKASRIARDHLHKLLRAPQNATLRRPGFHLFNEFLQVGILFLLLLSFGNVAYLKGQHFIG